MITLEYKITESIGRFYSDNYVRPVVVKVLGIAEDTATYQCGRIYADLVAWADALYSGESLEEICDDDSEGLLQVYNAIANKDGAIRPDLVDIPTNSVLFIYDVTLAPRLREYREAILSTVANLFGMETLTVSWLTATGFKESELADLGFRRIAETRVIYRHNCLTDRYSEEHPHGVDTFDFEPELEDERWVKRELARKGFIRRRSKPTEG